jgi:isoleucyl-tRNA synthetase
MAFAKVDGQVDFPAQERAVLDFWATHGTFAQLLAQNAGKPKWSFLDGPITANNPMGVHHAWGRTYKDAYQRYFAMTGHELRYQNGFDCQGLWVEVEVEKELQLHTKRDIENLVPGDRPASIAKFVNACKARVNKYARTQTEQSIRLGYWMDWDVTDADWAKPVDERKSYFTMAEENNYTIWHFLKTCHDRHLVYRGFDAMPWCPRCGVGLSEMEVKEGYKFIEHRAVFVKLPLCDKPGENLLVWTTTPWTLSSNVGAAVNPELTYLRVRSKGEIYYVAKGAFKANRMESGGTDEDGVGKKGKREWLDAVPNLKSLEQLFKEKSKDGYEIVGEVKGADMVGWPYVGPFDDLPAQQHAYGFPSLLADVVQRQQWAPAVSGQSAHRVVPWSEVGETEGTGIVHTAPGCGKEDFALGKQHGLPPIAPLDEAGVFLDGFGGLTGQSAVDPATADWVFAELQRKDRLFAIERYAHRYPHCWRCKTELLFRLVDEWFIKMDWREEIMRVVEQVQFLPTSINGRAKELDWLRNMGDWMISKKRYWGLALPIWVDDGDPTQFEVIGSRAELQARAISGWPEFDGHSPHKPWVDGIKIRNPRTGNPMSRIPDVGNPWLDAGIVPYSTMGYNRDRAAWEQWFPADFITECFPGQFRNWFYAILAMSTMLTHRPPFKVLLGHALVRDQNGDEMHKSKGNSIEFNGAADQGYRLFIRKEDKKAKLPDGALKTYAGEVMYEGKLTAVTFGEYKPMGADVIRWLYGRQNPAANINLGPGPTDEIRAKFHLKLWNTYAFFVNYARLDGFDPRAPNIPLAERAEIDRWILSDLQGLIGTAHRAFQEFSLPDFCLEAERFLDDKVSNWYVRSNRRRFWSKNAELSPAQLRDKQAAYQTLYTVLTTFVKLCAPVIPFLTETMYQNLRLPTDPASVHLCTYPMADQAVVDAQLSADTNALLRLVTLGSAARNLVKIKTRQPLAELRVQPGTEAERRAVERFAATLADELNVKRVTLHTGGDLLTAEIKLNMKVAGAKFGPLLKAVNAELAKLHAADAAKQAASAAGLTLNLPGSLVVLTAADVNVTYTATAGYVGICDHGTQVALDTRITPELAAEGLARDVVRLVQDARKNAGLEMDDTIELQLGTASDNLHQALATHQAYIAAEVQARTLTVLATVSWPTTAEGKVDGQPLVIALHK